MFTDKPTQNASQPVADRQCEKLRFKLTKAEALNEKYVQILHDILSIINACYWSMIIVCDLT